MPDTLTSFPIHRMVNKYFWPAAQSAEADLARQLPQISLTQLMRSRYFQLRTAQVRWDAPGISQFPAGLERFPPYWHMPWKAKVRPALSLFRRLELWARFPGRFARFKALFQSISSQGFRAEGLPVAGFLLAHPRHGDVFVYTDGHQRMGIYAVLSKSDTTLPVKILERVTRESVLTHPAALEGLRKGYFTPDDILRWFDHPFHVLGLDRAA